MAGQKGFIMFPQPARWLERKLSKMARPIQEKPLSRNAYWVAPLMKIFLFILLLLAVTIIEAVANSRFVF